MTRHHSAVPGTSPLCSHLELHRPPHGPVGTTGPITGAHRTPSNPPRVTRSRARHLHKPRQPPNPSELPPSPGPAGPRRRCLPGTCPDLPSIAAGAPSADKRPVSPVSGAEGPRPPSDSPGTAHKSPDPPLAVPDPGPRPYFVAVASLPSLVRRAPADVPRSDSHSTAEGSHRSAAPLLGHKRPPRYRHPGTAARPSPSPRSAAPAQGGGAEGGDRLSGRPITDRSCGKGRGAVAIGRAGRARSGALWRR